MYLLPLENVVVLIDNTKLTTYVSAEVCYCLGEVEARQFYTSRIQKQGGGLGLTEDRFNQVKWAANDVALASKPDMYDVWDLVIKTGVKVVCYMSQHGTNPKPD